MAEEKENLPVEEEGIEFGSDKKVAENTEFELIDEGTYEVVLEKLEPKTSTKNGKTTKYMNVTFTIRDDVDQPYKKRKIWYTIFARDNDVAFNFNAINAIIITQEGRKDYKRHFKNVDEIFQYHVKFQSDMLVPYHPLTNEVRVQFLNNYPDDLQIIYML